MDLGSLLLGLALFLVVAFIVAQPLLDEGRLPEEKPSRADELLAQREIILDALRDLDFDHATGKIPDEDHEAERARLVAQGVEVLKAVEALGAAAAEPDIEQAIAARRRGRSQPQAGDDAIEAEVAARRAAMQAAIKCGACGALIGPGDRFCAKCGAILSNPEAAE